MAWPWVVKLGGRIWTCMTCLILLPLSFFSICELSRAGPDAGSKIWLNSFVQFQFFALGALLALFLRGRAPTLGLSSRIGIFAAGLTSWLIADGMLRIDKANVSPSSGWIAAGYAFVATGCLLLFVSFLGLLPRWVPKPLVYLGKISYGLYVFHMLSLSVFWRLFWASESQRSSLQTGSGIILGARRWILRFRSLRMHAK